ncbi:hypothetical protein ACSVDA_24565 [Cytobacillus sp. Hm23]
MKLLSLALTSGILGSGVFAGTANFENPERVEGEKPESNVEVEGTGTVEVIENPDSGAWFYTESGVEIKKPATENSEGFTIEIDEETGKIISSSLSDEELVNFLEESEKIDSDVLKIETGL